MARCSHGETRRNIKDKEKKTVLCMEKQTTHLNITVLQKLQLPG
jgi:hypothetical protein